MSTEPLKLIKCKFPFNYNEFEVSVRKFSAITSRNCMIRRDSLTLKRLLNLNKYNASMPPDFKCLIQCVIIISVEWRKNMENTELNSVVCM